GRAALRSAAAQPGARPVLQRDARRAHPGLHRRAGRRQQLVSGRGVSSSWVSRSRVRAIAAALALLVPAAGQAVADDVMALVYSRGSGRAAIAVARPDSAAAVAAARQEC